MTKYRIKKVQYYDSTKYYIEQKRLWFWSILIDDRCVLSFKHLSDAIDEINRLKFKPITTIINL